MSINGQISHYNWNNAIKGIPLCRAYEVPLFTDSSIIGLSDYYPYVFIKTIAHSYKPREIKPAIILRVYSHLTQDDNNPSYQCEKSSYDLYHGGWINDEIAALMSLLLGIRLKSGGVTREFENNGDPKGRPIFINANSDPIFIYDTQKMILPKTSRECNLADSHRMSSFPNLAEKDAVLLIKAARLYQEALWIAESDPSNAWIMLVSSIESISGECNNEKYSSRDLIKDILPEFEKSLTKHCNQEAINEIIAPLGVFFGSTRKFVNFILEFFPDPPKDRPPEWCQLLWTEEEVKLAMSQVYNYRSKALHGGIPFPAPMCESPYRDKKSYAEVPIGLATHTKGATWVKGDTKILLHTFEYIVRNVLINWWDSIIPESFHEITTS